MLIFLKKIIGIVCWIKDLYFKQIILFPGSPRPDPPAKDVLRVYGMKFCPYVHRLKLVLAKKGIKYALKLQFLFSTTIQFFKLQT